MSLIINQVFSDEKFNKSLFVKQFESSLVPSIGMELEDSIWDKPKKIKKININPGHNSYALFVEDEFATKGELQKITEKYKNNGWTVSKI